MVGWRIGEPGKVHMFHVSGYSNRIHQLILDHNAGVGPVSVSVSICCFTRGFSVSKSNYSARHICGWVVDIHLARRL